MGRPRWPTPFTAWPSGCCSRSAAYRQQYDCRAISLLPARLYGPWDRFDAETCDIIPALIRQIMEARDDRRAGIELPWPAAEAWDFLYVRDAARGIVAAADNYDQPEPVNLGSGRALTIRELAESISRLCRYEGKILYAVAGDSDAPSPRLLDTSRARQELGFEATTRLEDGLRETVGWYETNRESLAAAAAA